MQKTNGCLGRLVAASLLAMLALVVLAYIDVVWYGWFVILFVVTLVLELLRRV